MAKTEEEQAAGEAVKDVMDGLVNEYPTEDGIVRELSQVPDTRALGERFLKELEYRGYKLTRDC